MATVNSASLRDEFDVIKTDITSMRDESKSTREADKIIAESCRLLEILIAILLEKTTKKTSKNSSIPPSQTDKDETRKSPNKNRDTSAAENSMTGENFKTITVEEISTVEVCDSCGTDLSDIEPSAREQRVLLDIEYTVKKFMVDAENKDCPEYHARTKGRFPENMPGPLQYGDGIKALVIDLLAAQMLSLRRCTELVQAITGFKLSEATCLDYIQRLYDSLEPWEAAAKEHLLTRPALHVDETGFRVNKENQWLHVVTDDSLTQGGKEMPETPKRRDGKRGRIAKSDAHNLHEALLILEESVLRFMSDPDVSFTNNTGEQKIRMSKVKIKVSGCFRTERGAHAWCRISSYLDSMKALGYNPHVAIRIALAGNAADMIKHHDQVA